MALLIARSCTHKQLIDDAIGAYLRRGGNADARIDKFGNWKLREPEWTAAQYKAHGNPILYWIQLQPKYPI